MAAFTKSVQVNRSRSQERARSERSAQVTALRHQGLSDPKFPVGRLRCGTGHGLSISHLADVRKARRTHQRPAGRAEARDQDGERVGRRRKPRRLVQSRCDREPKVRRGVWKCSPKNIDDPADPEVVWLSRGLLEACLTYIRGTPAGDGLRVAAYEFTYAPILNELKRA